MDWSQVDFNGRKLKVAKSGHGPYKLLCIPGGPGLTLEYLQVIHDQLRVDQFTVYSYQPSGTPGNENDPFYRSLAEYAIELKGVLNQLNIEDCSILGHSFGGAIAQEFAYQNNDYQLEKLVLVSAFSSGANLKKAVQKRWAKMPEEVQEERETLLLAADGTSYEGLLFANWISQHFCRVQPPPEALMNSVLPALNQPVYYYYVGYDLLNLSGAAILWDRSSEFKSINCPVMIIAGEYDYLDEEDIAEMTAGHPDVEAAIIENASHTAMLEQKESFHSVLQEFLSKK